MNSRRLLPLVLVATISAAAGWAVSQPAEPKQGATPPIDKKMIMSILSQRGGPVDQHKLLDAFVGARAVKIEMPMGPGAPSIAADATSEGKWVLGNRFIQIHTTPAEGEELKIESITYLGFDKRTEKYFWIGIDSTDTYSVFAEGTYDEKTKALTLFGENFEPERGGKVKFKTIFTLTGADVHSMQIMFQADDEMKKMAPPGALDADGWFKVVGSTSTLKK
jgi:hypothetical protein